METKRYTKESIDQAAEQLRKGEVIAFPTETVYGLGACAENEEAVKKVYLAKGRPSDNPLIVHIAKSEDILSYTDDFSLVTKKLMDTFWPGPLTIILPLKNQRLSKTVTGGLDTCAFRMPDKELTLQLLEKTGPLVGPSANTSGKPSPTTFDHVYHDLAGKVVGILDGGECQVGVESTVIDLSNEEEIVILRPGKIGVEELQQVVDVPVVYDQTILGEKGIPKAPGMKYRHYSPTTPVVMVEKKDFAQAIKHYGKEKVALLASDDVIAQFPNEKVFSLGNTLQEATQRLFAGLRTCDEWGVETILAEAFPVEKESSGIQRAYMNRLEKAAGGNQFLA